MDDGTLWRTLLNYGVISKVGDSEESSVFQVTIGTSWVHDTLAEAVIAKAKQVQDIPLVPVYAQLPVTEEHFQRRVLELISEQLGLHIQDIKPEKHFIRDLCADSLDIVELVMALEDEFGVEIPDEIYEAVTTVNDVLENKYWVRVGVKK